MNKTFYYRFKPFNLWLIFNILLVIKAFYCIIKHPAILIYPQSYIILACILISILVWCYKYLFKHPLATVSDKGIKIDHCQILKWKDIESTEKKDVYCGFKHMPVLVLNPKKDIEYKYNFLQKHNSGFTAFSIPLYDIVAPEDRDELIELIKQHIN